jgi:arsenate reductase
MGEMDGPFTIYHNPRCSKSRRVLEIIRGRGVEPEVIEYLKQPPDANRIRELARLLGVSMCEMVRDTEPVFRKLGLKDVENEEELVWSIVENPILLQRPLVVYGDRAVIARPPELVDRLF